MANDPPKDVNPPDLQQPKSVGPSVTGNPRVPDGDPARNPRGRRGKGVPQTLTPPPTHSAYQVSPGSVNDAGNQILANTQQAISAYENLKATVASTKSWIFWAPNDRPDSVVPSGAGPIDADPGYKNPDREQGKKIGAAEDNLLLEIGDSITLAGQFADQINNAAQFYAQADKASVLPELIDGTKLQYGHRYAVPGSPKDGAADPAQGGQDPSAGRDSGPRNVSD